MWYEGARDNCSATLSASNTYLCTWTTKKACEYNISRVNFIEINVYVCVCEYAQQYNANH